MSTQQKNSKVIKAIIWICQGILASTFIWAGSMKLLQPGALPFPWIKGNSGLVMITGVVDLSGGICIIIPSLLRIWPRLTLLAAYGIIALMTCAIIFHISRGEANNIGFNVFILLLAVAVAWYKNVPR